MPLTCPSAQNRLSNPGPSSCMQLSMAEQAALFLQHRLALYDATQRILHLKHIPSYNVKVEVMPVSHGLCRLQRDILLRQIRVHRVENGSEVVEQVIVVKHLTLSLLQCSRMLRIMLLRIDYGINSGYAAVEIMYVNDCIGIL